MARDGKGGRVIHSVTDHSDVTILVHETTDVIDLLLRQEISESFVDARLFGDGGGGSLVVAAEHDDLLDSGSVNLAERLDHLGPQCVGDGDDAEDLTVTSIVRLVANHGEGLPLFLDGGKNAFDPGTAETCLMR